MFYAAPVWGTISPQLLVHRRITVQPYDKLLHQQLKKKKETFSTIPDFCYQLRVTNICLGSKLIMSNTYSAYHLPFQRDKKRMKNETI